MARAMKLLCGVVVVASTLVGCTVGSDPSSHPGDDVATVDAGVGTPDAPAFVEAPHAAAPQVVSLGGPVIASPTVLPIFFANDATVQGEIETFGSWLAISTYWTIISREYGIGPISFLPTIVSTDAPPTTDAALQTWLASYADGTHAGWPKADANTIYAVYLPAGVTLTASFGTSCTAFGGYHSEGLLADGTTKFIYALLPRCGPAGAELTDLTAAVSHEFLEASADPYYSTAPAYRQSDNNDIIWTFAPGAELGDMCAYTQASFQDMGIGTLTSSAPYTVQRTWSNASAAAGHDPCVPTLAQLSRGPYLSAAPVLPDMLTIDNIPTQGVNVPLGQSVTIEVDLFSDGPVSIAWQVAAADAATLSGQPAQLTFAWDATTGNNGDKLHLTITRTAESANPTQNPSELYITTYGNSTYENGIPVAMWWGYVGG